MKKLIFAFVGLAVIFSAPFAIAKGGKSSTGTMRVQVREAAVKSTPNYLGASAGLVTYGNEVNVIGEQGNWYQIEKPAGYLPKSALTKHKVAVNPDQKFAGKSAKNDEVALAGKGFNPQVEAQYKRDNASIAAAYAVVDQIEKFLATEAELKQFQAAGKLTPR